MSARRYESSACVYGVNERVDDFDCFVEVGDRHVEAAGHSGVSVAPVGVGRDVRWPRLPATCGEYALAGVLDGREILYGQGLEELQVDEVPVARVLPPGRSGGSVTACSFWAICQRTASTGMTSGPSRPMVLRSWAAISSISSPPASTGATSTTSVMKGLVRSATFTRVLRTCGRSSSGWGSLRSKENSS